MRARRRRSARRLTNSARRSPTAGIGLVYGGGHVGLMGVVADAALAAGGEVIGVITEQLVRRRGRPRRLTRLEVVPTMHERKARLAELADGFVVLPGGFGTVDEFAEALTWNQLGLIAKPVVLLDVDGFWAPLFDLDRGVDAGFIRPSIACSPSGPTPSTARSAGDLPTPRLRSRSGSTDSPDRPSEPARSGSAKRSGSDFSPGRWENGPRSFRRPRLSDDPD